MILRNLERRPLKALLTLIGISFACAILIVGSFQEDAIDYMVTVQFGLAQRDDISVTFVEPHSRRALYELTDYPELITVNRFGRFRYVLYHRQHSYRTAIQGLTTEATLQRLLDTELELVTIPQEGILLVDYLGQKLDIQPW